MRTGKISENVLKRSVLKRCISKNNYVAQGPGIGQDCAIVRVEGQNSMAVHNVTVCGYEKGKLYQAVYNSANNIESSACQPISVAMGIVMPVEAEETVLRDLCDEINAACCELGIAIAGGHTEVSDVVKDVVITITCMGISATEGKATSKIHAGLDLIMIGKTGLCGTALLARRYEKELKQRFPIQLVEDAAGFDQKLSVHDAAVIGWKYGAIAMHDVSEGGIFGALWELCESNGTGMEADLKKIPIRQETIEICEVYGLNPYQLMSGGSILIAAKDGDILVDRLAEAGIEATVIGWTTEKKDKILRNGEEFRFLDKPAQDQIRMV